MLSSINNQSELDANFTQTDAYTVKNIKFGFNDSI